ncbi:Peptidyl-prolyl cis-trans isomerase fpr2 [Ascosphaera pollenicola]|nr:Peptidyl-prolyl cis-trans isomerase fpr2 [Ascosphaera pollenicola]
MRFFTLFSVALTSLLSTSALAAEEVKADGLKIDVTHEVKCNRPTKNGDNIEMHYTGYLLDGTKFDASYDRGTPLTFKLGTGRVIKGWDEGLQNMCVGEKRKLTIPPALAYGQRAVGPIPAGSTLVFDTELVTISGVPKEDL